MRSPNPLFAPLAAALLSPACGPAVVSGGVEVFTPGPAHFHEREPNDSAAGPDYLTVLYAGDALEITGHVDDGCCDPFDGFAIDTAEPLELQLELVAHDGWSDLDLCVYDPVADVFLACYENEGSTEYGSVAIALPAELHLVVRSWSGSSSYSLYVDAYGLPGGYLAATAPADPSSGWTDYAAAPEGPFELRVERLPEADEDAPPVHRVLVRPAR